MRTKELVRLASEFLAEAKFSKSLRSVMADIRIKMADTPAGKGKPLVLCVEDDEDILAMLKLMLEGRGYEVLAADTIEKAITLAISHDNIHSLITDYHIHGRTASDLLVGLGDRKPKNVILLSGKHFSGDPKQEVPGIDSHVSKPFSLKKLVEKIDVNDDNDLTLGGKSQATA